MRWLRFQLSLLLLLTLTAARADGLNLDAWRGRVVVVDFWASWCTPCRASFPWLMQLQQRFGPQGLTVITVNLDEQRPDAERFLRETGSTLPVHYDPQGLLASHYQLTTMPSTLLFDRQGRLHQRHNGFFESRIPAYEDAIRHLLSAGQH